VGESGKKTGKNFFAGNLRRKIFFWKPETSPKIRLSRIGGGESRRIAITRARSETAAVALGGGTSGNLAKKSRKRWSVDAIKTHHITLVTYGYLERVLSLSKLKRKGGQIGTMAKRKKTRPGKKAGGTPAVSGLGCTFSKN